MSHAPSVRRYHTVIESWGGHHSDHAIAPLTSHHSRSQGMDGGALWARIDHDKRPISTNHGSPLDKRPIVCMGVTRTGMHG